MSTTITQSIHDYIELSKLTKQPILLISNPGFGKTTSITNWANENGYHYEQLIGSRFSSDEIMGYQVNEPGSLTLIQKDPIWFQRIMNALAAGKPTILFIDEISTCSEEVQGSLLSLIFDRRIGNGKPLPENCIIMAAANYSENLPNYMSIMAPTINRFCVVNLLWGFSNSEIILETLTRPEILQRKVTEVNVEEIERSFNEMINEIIIKYSQPNSSIGFIDLNNHDIANIYKRKGNVYNIMSWRSITYLRNFVVAMTRLGINEETTIRNICAGMIGLGSNNFTSEKQIDSFIDIVSSRVKQIIDLNYDDSEDMIQVTDDMKISEVINEYIARSESTRSIGVTKLENSLVELIVKRYGDYAKVYEELKSGKMNSDEFINDMDAMTQIFLRLMPENAKIAANVHQSLISLYDNLLGCPSTIFSKDVYGINISSVIKRTVIAKDSSGKISRIGVFGNNDHDCYTEIPDGTLVSQTVLSGILPKSKVNILTLEKVI